MANDHEVPGDVDESSDPPSAPVGDQVPTDHPAGTPADADEHERDDDRADERDQETAEPTDSHGITDEDMDLIAAFLEKSRHERSVDDLRPSSEN